MSTPILVTGDDFNLPVILTANAVPVNLTGSVITAAIVNFAHDAVILAGIAQPQANAGSDWPNGIAGIAFSKADTADISTYGIALIEIQVAGVTTSTWFTPVMIIKGNIF